MPAGSLAASDFTVASSRPAGKAASRDQSDHSITSSPCTFNAKVARFSCMSAVMVLSICLPTASPSTRFMAMRRLSASDSLLSSAPPASPDSAIAAKPPSIFSWSPCSAMPRPMSTRPQTALRGRRSSSADDGASAFISKGSMSLLITTTSPGSTVTVP